MRFFLGITAFQEGVQHQLRRGLNRPYKTRADLAEKFEELIEAYNAGSRNIEELFEESLKLSQSSNEEQQRHVRKHRSEEELGIFDILTRPAPELCSEERAEVKKAAKLLVDRIKTLLVLNWRQKAAARAQLRLAIEDGYDISPNPFTLYVDDAAICAVTD